MADALDRRRLLALVAAGALGPHLTAGVAAANDEPVTIGWADLVPTNDELGTFYSTLKELGLLNIGQNQSMWAVQPPAAMTEKYNDKLVRIPGYIVPLGFVGSAVTEGLLVPYVGACIHVPPPPANQIVFIRLKEMQDQASLWDPVWATGAFSSQAVETELADVGYMMVDATLEAYSG